MMMVSSCSSSSSDKKPGFVLLQHIPTDIIEDILSRLPTETVLECKLVCKSWLSIVRQRCFADKHLQHQLLAFDHFHNHKYYPACSDSVGKNRTVTNSKKIGFIAVINEVSPDDDYKIFYMEYSDKLITTTKRINHRLFPDNYNLIGSCNGLICIAANYDEVVYICNPITRECVYLPEFTSWDSGRFYSFGFGYVATSKEYKAVRITYKTKQSIKSIFRRTYRNEGHGLVQVYTLGSGTGWRDKGTIAQLFIVSAGAFADGLIYWLDNEDQVWAFDLGGEKFSLLTRLPFNCDMNSVERDQKLVVLGGWLSVLDVYRHGVDIWSFKVISEEQELRNWIKEFYIKGYNDYFTAFGLTNIGELICSRRNSEFWLYDKNSEPICRLEETPLIIPLIMDGILHVNSFISLIGLGEGDVKVIEPADTREENKKSVNMSLIKHEEYSA